MNQNGELYDLRNAPFEEVLVAAGTGEAEAEAARKRLSAVLAELNPAGGKIDDVPAANGNQKKKNKAAD